MKTILILLLLAVSLPGLPVVAQSKKATKQAKKQIKKKTSEVKKNGFEIYGSYKTLETAMFDHWTSMEARDEEGNKKYKEIMVTTTNCPNVNLCQRKAQSDAYTQYATDVNSFVIGKITSTAAFDALAEKQGKGKTKENQDKFAQAFEQRVSANVSNQLELSYALLKNTKKEISMETHFIVERDAARRAREQAYQQAINDAKQSNMVTQEHLNYMQSVSDMLSEDMP